MLAQVLYFVAIASFGFVVLAAAQLPTGIWLVLSLFPVFLALVLGGMLWIVAFQEFSLPVSFGSLAVPAVAAILVRRWSERDLLIAIGSASLLGLLFAGLAINTVSFG